uniref:Putative salivary cysteine-rich peptide n=1 Tax=Psorophora albipes TaxID=869069 RepID=T1DJ53_9DIPT
MAKFLVLGLVILAVIVAIDGASFGQCPVASKVQTCTPKCLSDVDCSSIGGKCCPNTCNYKSCVSPTQLSNAASKGGSGAYCGNVKCNSFEKCDLDRTTKRQKCVRA